MKKLRLALLTILILITSDFIPVQADELASCGYQVAYINDDGSFSMESCHSDFNTAKNRMKELGGDVVVRHEKSNSYAKIIAMNSGIAYSYPRDGATLNIYQHVSIRSIHYKQTYIARHFELNYLDTERYLGDGRGMVEVNVNGFHGYTDLEYVDLVPSKFLKNNIAITLGGNNNYQNEGFFTFIPRQTYYENKRTGNYNEMIFHIYRGFPSSNQEPVHSLIAIGPAPSDMKEGVKYYSNDGINFYTDSEFKEFAFKYYNYYQYLPLRSKTNITAETLNKYISSYKDSAMKDAGQIFIDAQNKYGINALLLFSMASHESGGGTSGYAKKRNNLFGWNAVDADPGQATAFSSIANCVNEQSGINLRGFVDITDGRFFSSSLGNKGSGLNVKYASDPYWGIEIASIAYQIDKLSKDKNGELTDFNNYSLSLIKDFGVSVKQEPSNSSKTLYTTEYGEHYQKDFIVIDLGTQGEFTKIQSTNPIDSNGNIKTHRTPITTGTLNPISYGEYDFDRSIAYIETSHLEVINKKNETNLDVPDQDLSLMHMVENMSIEDGNLKIDGVAFIKGMSAGTIEKIAQKINIVNILDNSIKSYTAKTKEYQGISFNDSHTYKYVGFEISIPLNEIGTGNYYLNIEVINEDKTLSGPLTSLESSLSNYIHRTDNQTYRLGINSYYNYRYELNVENIPDEIDYNAIKKPYDSIRNSLFSFDTLTLNENLDFSIEGQSMIYYTNYDKPENIKRTIYLINSKDNYKTIDCESYKSSIDFTNVLNSSYSLDYISFKANTNLKELEKGTYLMVMKIEVDDYIDYVELNNLSGLELPVQTVDGVDYQFITDPVRERLMLKIS